LAATKKALTSGGGDFWPTPPHPAIRMITVRSGKTGRCPGLIIINIIMLPWFVCDKDREFWSQKLEILKKFFGANLLIFNRLDRIIAK
jgi:hypothetical protein